MIKTKRRFWIVRALIPRLLPDQAPILTSFALAKANQAITLLVGFLHSAPIF
jgi:hypothetical protein